MTMAKRSSKYAIDATGKDVLLYVEGQGKNMRWFTQKEGGLEVTWLMSYDSQKGYVYHKTETISSGVILIIIIAILIIRKRKHKK